MRINPKFSNKHDHHEVVVQLCGNNSPHAAQLRCQDCNKWLKWLSLEDAIRISDLIGDIQ